TGVQAATGRSTHDNRNRGPPAIMRFGGIVRDDVERARYEIDELHLRHRPHSIKRRADRGPHNGRFRNRSVDDALLAEMLLHPGRDFERAAICADVFTQQKYAWVGLHLFPETLADRFKIRDHGPILPYRCGVLFILNLRYYSKK